MNNRPQDRPLGRVEDYTGFCLVMLFVNLLWIMVALWAWKGFFAALCLGFIVHKSVDLLDARLTRIRATAWPNHKRHRDDQASK